MKRPRRALLFVPGTEAAKLEKAAKLGVDCVIADWEDAAALSKKAEARATTLAALAAVDFGRSERVVRVNPVGSGLEHDDFAALAAARTLPDALMLPKVEDAMHVRFVSSRLAEIERARGLALGTIRIIGILETALGLVNAREIAFRGSAPRRARVRRRGLLRRRRSHTNGRGSRGRVGQASPRRPCGRGALASARHAVRRLERRRALEVGHASLDGARLHGPLGDPPETGRADRRGVHAERGGSRSRAAPRRRTHASSARRPRRVPTGRQDGRHADGASGRTRVGAGEIRGGGVGHLRPLGVPRVPTPRSRSAPTSRRPVDRRRARRTLRSSRATARARARAR
jgi:hypothetical protein